MVTLWIQRATAGANAGERYRDSQADSPLLPQSLMFTLSAFDDEISPDPQEQIDVLSRCGVRHIEFRSAHQTNVLDLSDQQIADFKALLDRHGFKLSAIGSPIGKVKID